MDIWYVSEFYKMSIIGALNFVVDLTGSTMPLVSGMGWKSPRLCLNTAACSVSSFAGLLLSSQLLQSCFWSTIEAKCPQKPETVRQQGRVENGRPARWCLQVFCHDRNKHLQGFGAPEKRNLKSGVQHWWEGIPFLHHSPITGIESSPVEETVAHQMMALLFECQECVVISGGVIL